MVEFSKRDELRDWLKDKPREWSVVIAARAGLRVAPQLGAFGFVDVGGSSDIITFRAMSTTWVAATWPGRRAELRVAARMAAKAAKAVFRMDAAPPAAARTVYGRVAARSAVQVVDAAAIAVEGHDIWDAVSADATALEASQPMGLRPADLAIQSLWPTGAPGWAMDNWRDLKKAWLEANQDWQVWSDWYDARLLGATEYGLPNENLELARVMIADEIWQLGPKFVNGYIKRLIAEHEEREIFQHAVSDNSNPSIEPVPSQGPGPQFRANQDGLVDRAPPADLDAGGNDIRTINQLKPLVLRCAADLQAHLSRNQFPELLDSAKSYQEALNPANGEIEWGEVWGLGVLLQNAATSAERKIVDRILPALEDNAKTALDSLLTMHGPMILATRDGARLSETAAGFSMTREQQESLRDAAQRIADQLKASPDVITPRAAASVGDAVEAIGQGKHPERGSVYGLATVKNISIVLIGGAAAATPTVIGALLGGPVGAIVGAPLSLVVVEAVKKNAAFAALVTQLGAHLDVMTDFELRGWLEDRAKRLAPFRSFVITNEQSLRDIAVATPELKWLLKYLDFIVAEPKAPNSQRKQEDGRVFDSEAFDKDSFS